MIGFVAVALAILGLIHLYLWKRLVRDTTRRVRGRRWGGLAAIGMAALFPLTIFFGDGRPWLAWPGFLWIAVMFYLLVVLAAMELPLLGAKLWLRSRSAAAVVEPAPEPALVGAPRRAGRPPMPDPAAPLPPRSHRFDPLPDHPPPHPRPSDPASSDPASSDPAADDPASSDPPADDRAAGDPPAGHPPAQHRPVHRSPVSRAPAPDPRADPPGDHDPDRRLFLARGAAIAAGLTASAITGYGVRTALGPPAVRRLQVPLAKLDPRADGLRVAVVADIHIGPLAGTGHTRRIAETVNRLEPDLIALVGDLTSSRVDEVDTATAPLAGLRSRYGAFFVTGNHEYYVGHREWITEAEALGMRVLRNERLEIAHRGGAIDLAGVNDLAGEEYGEPPDFGRALGDRDPAKPVVLLAHQPVQARQAARYGVDLQLSGHTHGGQLVPFNLLVRLQQPVVSGLGRVSGVPVYVTNGAGFWGPPVRVGAPPEIALLELRSA